MAIGGLPVRSEEELRRRLAAGEPFHLVTLLRDEWVKPLAKELETHLGLPLEEQQRLLVEALVARGCDAAAAAAVVSVPRHLLVADELRQRAYLDEYHRVVDWSGLTPPSLVALMLERLRLGPGVRVLELGVGSAFHALAVLGLCPSAEVVGVEVDGEVLARTRRCLGRLGETPALRLFHGAGPEAAAHLAPFDRIYATYAYRAPVSALLPFVADGGLVQVPRLLSPHEWRDEPLLDSLRKKHSTYESLLEEWQQHLCLATYQRDGKTLRVVDKLFGVRFVGQRDALVPEPQD